VSRADAPNTGPPQADVLVIFGITGDLARVMTFRSLYLLEARGILDCPVVGVAFEDWSLEQLVARARTSIVDTGEELDEAVFERFAKRLSYYHGDFNDASTYAEVAKAIEGKSTPVFYLEIPPSLFGTVADSAPTVNTRARDSLRRVGRTARALLVAAVRQADGRAQHQAALEVVAQLAHVARPAVPAEYL